MPFLAAICTGQAREVAAKSGLTGIDKQPVEGPVGIGPEGVAGDTIVDRANHGGAEQAVYAYCAPDAAFWAERLGRDIAPGTFGENLHLGGIESADFAVGDELWIGPVRLQVTSPRIPCATLAARMDDPGFVRAFHRAGRPGPYFRVLAGGTVAAGQAVRFVPFDGPRLPIAEMAGLPAPERIAPALRARLLSLPIHAKLRAALAA
ncbi:MOSC domain-containing protein YiiM [Wenxinia saemankumensis]|uniref:MOSC domain-containing protein YiiM n=2 Tax=Wenxinia saemankumensis TaxID=1447782 RepID=A0A1M6EU78_9RHOB|nr:MOSC domain-containing protein YiiM [Wenxinia saemankumensis]